MKWIALAIVVLVGLSAIVLYPNVQTFTLDSVITETIIKTEVKSDLTVRVESEQEAARHEIEKLAQEAYDRAFQKAMKEIELRVTEQYRKELQEKEQSLLKDLSL